MENAPPAPDTSGNLHSPVMMGRGVEGNVRSRMADEHARRN